MRRGSAAALPRLPPKEAPAVPLSPAGARARPALDVLPAAQRHAAAVRASAARLLAHLRPPAGRCRLGAPAGARQFLITYTIANWRILHLPAIPTFGTIVYQFEVE